VITVPEVPDMQRQAAILVPHIKENAPRLRDLANQNYTQGLPADWPLSTGRVSLTTVSASGTLVHDLATTAFDEFEYVAVRLISEEPKVVSQLLAGVDVDPAVQSYYVGARSPFSVRRLDVLQVPGGMQVTENDEQPGGLGLSYLYDLLYGVNLDRWQYIWQELTKRGKLVFVVSDNWSQAYHTEIKWLVTRLCQEGYDATFLSTGEMGRMSIHRDRVTVDSQPVGTVFRLFPIFETTGGLADLVCAADRGAVRLVPEFASWGNKTWFALFHEHSDFFRAGMTATSYELLSRMVPQTVLVQDGQFSAPFIVDGHCINELDELGNSTKSVRRQLVVKVTGANDRAARSYGVGIGTSFQSGAAFRDFLGQLLRNRTPFLVQAYTKGQDYSLPTYSVLENAGRVEHFGCRMLMRPWSIAGVNVGLVTASPQSASLIHGTTASAFVPIQFS
jgi:hypothetical protein